MKNSSVVSSRLPGDEAELLPWLPAHLDQESENQDLVLQCCWRTLLMLVETGLMRSVVRLDMTMKRRLKLFLVEMGPE